MRSLASTSPDWTLHAPVHDESREPDATILHRAREAASAEATALAVASLPRIDVARSEDAELSVSGVIGKGGMGIVQLARQRSLSREVAIKRLRPEGSLEANAVASLLVEARIQGALEHPNVVPTHALGRDVDDLPVLVMKRVSGVSWQALIRDPRHPAWPKDVDDQFTWHLEALMQVCNAVHFAHSRGVIHRDIKPSNVMIGAFGEVYLLDWGIAYAPRLEDAEGAADPTIVGTPAYMAPEMLHGTGPRLSARTDVYLLGATLHKVLTGKARHLGNNVLSVLHAVEGSAPFDYPPSVPAELAALCNRATHQDPDERPSSALAFRQAVAEYLRHRGSIGLAQAAAARLAELRAEGIAAGVGGEGEPERAAQIRRLYGEANFGFKQALLAWEGNEPARAGAAALSTWMIGYELSRRNAEAAAALLVEFAPCPPALAAQVEALRTELAREREDLLRLKDIKHNRNPQVAFRQRIVVAAGSVVVAIVTLIALSWLHGEGLTHQDFIIAGSPAILIVSVTLIVRPRGMLETQISRNVVITVLLFIVGSALNHAVAWKLRLPVHIAVVWDMLMSVAVGAACAIFLSWIFWVTVISCLLGVVFAVRWPAHALLFMVCVMLLSSVGNGLLAWHLLRGHEKAPRR